MKQGTLAEGRWWGLAGVLMGVCLALRVPGLMALPIFGDESIYLHWAQVIRGEGISGGPPPHWWVSLIDPKPPLHFWLLAAVFRWTEDPLIIARLLSVAAGIASIPLMLGIGSEFGYFMKGGLPAGRKLGFVAAILALFCPFLAFYQRLATADALFVTESLLIVYLSLRWGRLATRNRKRNGWLTALALGMAIGAGLLTRQGVSYTICAMPAFAWVMHAWIARRLGQPVQVEGVAGWPEARRLRWLKSLIQLILAAVIAAAVWMPYLTAELQDRAVEGGTRALWDPRPAATRDEIWTELRRRIMYQAKFTETRAGHADLAKRNAFVTFVAGRNDQGAPNSGWLPLYMTPVVYAACLLGMAYTALRQRRVLVLLLVWLVLLLGPVIFLVDTIYSRYVLAGVPPLLFAGAMVLGDVSTWLMRGRGARLVVGAVAAVALWAGLGLVPGQELVAQWRHWPAQVLTANLTWGDGFIRGDRYQYLTGWTAGLGTRGAIEFLRAEARVHADKPMVVITTSSWGTPADAVWVYLSREPNVQLYWIGGKLWRGAGAQRDTYRLRTDKWLFGPEKPVHFVPGTLIYYVTNDPIHADVDIPATQYLQEVKANFGPPRTFNGLEDENVKVMEVVP